MLWSDLAVNEQRTEREGKGVLGMRRGFRHAGKELCGFCKRVHVYRGYVMRGESVLLNELAEGVDCAMRPSAYRIGLYVILLDRPVLAEIAPAFRDFFGFDGCSRGSLEPFLCQQHRHEARERAHAGAVMQHGRVCDFAHHLLRGPWYSAMPSACRSRSASRCRSRAPSAATPSAFQAPDVW